MRFFAFLSAFAITLGITSPGLGYRTLWADELETAERARSIVESGLPKIFDSAGNLSVSSAGKEIEEGLLHRYTPWLQFYVGAAGIEFGRRFGLASDTGVRLPFIILHAATSGLIARGLVAGLSIGALPAIGIATLYGLGSVRLIHARTARYHALTDFLFIAAWIVFGKIRRRRRLSPGASASAGMTVLLGVILIALLHTQTLVGILGASIFSLLFFIEERVSKRTLLLALLVLVGVGTLFLLVLGNRARSGERSLIGAAADSRAGSKLTTPSSSGSRRFFSYLDFGSFRIPPTGGGRKRRFSQPIWRSYSSGSAYSISTPTPKFAIIFRSSDRFSFGRSPWVDRHSPLRHVHGRLSFSDSSWHLSSPNSAVKKCRHSKGFASSHSILPREKRTNPFAKPLRSSKNQEVMLRACSWNTFPKP